MTDVNKITVVGANLMSARPPRDWIAAKELADVDDIVNRTHAGKSRIWRQSPRRLTSTTTERKFLTRHEKDVVIIHGGLAAQTRMTATAYFKITPYCRGQCETFARQHFPSKSFSNPLIRCCFLKSNTSVKAFRKIVMGMAKSPVHRIAVSAESVKSFQSAMTARSADHSNPR